MKKNFLIFFLLVSIIAFPPTYGKELENTMELKKGDDILTITQSSGYYETEFVSSSSIISKGKMYTTSFNSIVLRLIEVWPDVLAENGISVNLTYNGVSYIGYIDPAIPSHEYAYSILVSVFGRYSGNLFDGAKVWPADYSLTVLESFPEQYSVSSIILRGPDLLAVVVEFTAYLFVWRKVDIAEEIKNNLTPNLDQAIHYERKDGNINSGGEYTEIEFPTFSVGTNYRPEDLIFSIVIDISMAILVLSETPYGTVLNNTTIPTVTETSVLRFSSITAFFLFLGALFLRKKKINRPL